MASDEYYAPYETEDGGVCVSPRQRKIHERTELTSAAIGTPFLLYLATRRRPLEEWERNGLVMLGMGALVVDSMLYNRFRRARRRRSSGA